jgi:hypothetical protein
MLPVDRVVGPPEKLRALDEVLNSRTFARSDQLQRFLRYIIELELAGRGEEISEYSIATDALLRPRDYSPTDDSAVRSRAHALRRKLQEFYESEGANSELRIELPKGSYRPSFVTRSQPARTPAVEPPPAAAPKKFALTPLAAFAAGVLVAGVLAAVVHLNVAATRANPVDPAVREAWGALLAPPGQVTILMGSPALAGLISSKADAPPLGLNMFPAPEMLANWYTGLNLSNRGGPVYMFRSRAYTHFGDSLAVVTASTLLGSAGMSFQTVPEGLARIATVQGNGLLAVGSPTYSPYIARVLKAMPFSIRYDPALNEEVISDGAPGSAVRRVYVPKRDSATTYFSNSYGLITVLPSQPGRERPERTIIFSGITGSSGAHAAATFFTSPAAIRDLQRRFAAQGHSHFPPAYQVVVRCGLDGFAALNAVYEAHQIIDRTPVIE